MNLFALIRVCCFFSYLKDRKQIKQISPKRYITSCTLPAHCGYGKKRSSKWKEHKGPKINRLQAKKLKNICTFAWLIMNLWVQLRFVPELYFWSSLTAVLGKKTHTALSNKSRANATSACASAVFQHFSIAALPKNSCHGTKYGANSKLSPLSARCLAERFW